MTRFPLTPVPLTEAQEGLFYAQLLDPANPDVPIAQVPQQAFALFMGSSAGLLHNPGRLAMVLAAVLLVALVMGVWLWRGERR